MSFAVGWGGVGGGGWGWEIKIKIVYLDQQWGNTITMKSDYFLCDFITKIYRDVYIYLYIYI